VVDAAGNPLRPTVNTDGVSPYPDTAALHYASVFGALPSTLPAANADCSNIAALVQPNTNWDPSRKAVDSTGFVTKLLGKIPTPNNYELGDGLNTAGLRWGARGGTAKGNIFWF